MICIVDNFYTTEVEKELKHTGFRMTELASTGGFLRKGSTTFLVGIEEKDVKTLNSTLKEACLKVEERKGRRRGDNAYRYTSFLIDSSSALPFLQSTRK